MRDPRLVEIEFLADVDSVETVLLQCRLTADPSHYVQIAARRATYGLDVRRLRDLVLELMLAGAIVSPKPLGRPDVRGSHPHELRHDRSNLVMQFTSGIPVTVAISHAGRLRLWTMRDELLRNPDEEPMGLLSKLAWERALPVQLQFAGNDEPLSIIFIDLDDFGKVNKEFGAAVGDDVLRAAFSVIKNFVGARGRVYRYGGEEVAVLLPNTDLDAGRALAEEIRAMIEASVHVRAGLKKPQTASIGIATFGERTEARAAIERVDGGMREAKRTGKNRVIAA